MICTVVPFLGFRALSCFSGRIRLGLIIRSFGELAVDEGRSGADQGPGGVR